MSAILTPYNNNVVQIGVYTAGDTYTHIRAGNLQFPGVSCDTVSDLPAQAGGIPGYYLEQGSTAHIIADNTEYMIDSGGNWILQDTSPYSNVYTKTEVDNLLTPITDDITTLYTANSTLREYVAGLINDGAKNRLNVFATASQIINGVSWVINADGTVTANGTATANSFFYLIPNNANIAFGEATIISGCPAGGSASTYEIQVAMVAGTIYHDYGDGESIPFDYVYRYFVCCVRNGYNANNLIFRPMICDTWKYAITPAFVPYSPTNAEIMSIIRGYHP